MNEKKADFEFLIGFFLLLENAQKYQNYMITHVLLYLKRFFCQCAEKKTPKTKNEGILS